MSTIHVLRDLALTVGGIAITAMAVHELTDQPARRPEAGDGLPATRHGWLVGLDSLSADRPRRLRPATATEAAASTASREAGDGGWIAVTSSGQILPLDAPQVLAAAGRYYSATDRVDVVYVDTTGRPAGSILASALLAEADTVLAGDAEADWTDDVSAYDAEDPADHADASSS
jgi:hypothetical protein